MKLKKDLSNKLEVEQECATKLNKLLERYKCRLVPVTVLTEGKVISRVEVHINVNLLKNTK